MSRTWIVTGASRGIGAAIAAEAVDCGDVVVLVARSSGADDVATTLRDRGGQVAVVHEDVTAVGAAERIVAAAIEAFGSLDVLVNNAGIHRGGRIERLAEGDFEAVLQANLVAPFRLSRAALARMSAGAAIVNVGAVVGMRGFSGDSPYGSAKAGLAGLTRVLAIEVARRGITVNCVLPGFTETEMTAGVDDRARQRILDRIPIARPCEAYEIAEVVRWVAQSRAMTGAMIPVDGGLMAALGASR
jgi:3-oxoacyl-[acyl-carrier protein] reductase